MKIFNPRNKIFFQTKQLKNYIINLKKKKKKKWNLIKKINRNIFFIRKSKKYYQKKQYYKKKKIIKKFYILLKKKKKLFSFFLKNSNIILKKQNLLMFYMFFKINFKKHIKYFKYKKFYNTALLRNNEKFIQKKKFNKKKLKNTNKIFDFQLYNKDYLKIILYLKQNIKTFYGRITNHNLKKIFKLYLKKKKKNKNLNLYNFLDSRLDNCLVQIGLAKNIFEARQLITHNKIIVNSKIIKSCNFFLKPGDIFSLKTDNILIIKKKKPINLLYSYFFKGFIFLRYLKKNEIFYNFNSSLSLLNYSLKN